MVEKCQDAGVVQTKLHWWREELDKLSADQPQHPVSQALAPYLRQNKLNKAGLQEIIEGALMDLAYDAYPSFQELTLYGHRLGSSLALLSAELIGYQDRKTTRFAHLLGMALILMHLLEHTRHHALRGRFYIPEDELARFRVSHEDLMQPHTPERIVQLFQFQAQRIRDYRQQALDCLPATERYRQRSQLILAELAIAQLDEIEADGFRLLEQRVLLTPLRKFWIAWKAQRRELRHQRRLSKMRVAGQPPAGEGYD